MGRSSNQLPSSESKASRLGEPRLRTGGIKTESLRAVRGAPEGMYSRNMNMKSFFSPQALEQVKSQTKQEQRPQLQLAPTSPAGGLHSTQHGHGSPASPNQLLSCVARTMPINRATDLRIQVKSSATTTRSNKRLATNNIKGKKIE